jgi:hypothetical protein
MREKWWEVKHGCCVGCVGLSWLGLNERIHWAAYLKYLEFFRLILK